MARALWVATWRSLAYAEADHLTYELERLPDADQRTVDGIAAAKQLKRARDATGVVRDSAIGQLRLREGLGGFWARVRRIGDSWTGSEIEATWSALHAAGESLTMIESASTLLGELPDIEAAILSTLAKEDSRTKEYIDKIKEVRTKAGRPRGVPTVGRPMREDLRGIRKVLNATSDGAHRDVRSYRNAIALISWYLAIVLFAIAAASITDQRFQTVFAVKNTSSGTWMALEIMFVGSLAGLTGVLLTLRSFTGFQNSYSLVLAQSFMKGTAGGAAAILGVLLVQSGIITSLTTQDRLALFGYAVLFGSSQQLITQLLDKKATQLLGAAQSRNDASATPAGA